MKIEKISNLNDVHKCIYCVGHKKASFVMEINDEYCKQPYPRWIKCICGDCHFRSPHGFSTKEAIKNHNKWSEKESAWGQTVLDVFQASHRG